MPFNSNNNTSMTENLNEIKNSHNFIISQDEDYTQLLRPQLIYKPIQRNLDVISPGHTGLVPYYNKRELQYLNNSGYDTEDEELVGNGIGSFLKSSAKSLANKAKDKAKEEFSKAKDKAKEELKKAAEKAKQKAKEEARKQYYKGLDYTANKAQEYLERKQQEYEGRGYYSDEYDSELEGAGFGSFIRSIKKSAKKTGDKIKKSIKKTDKDFKKAGKNIKKTINKIDKDTKPLQKVAKKVAYKVGDEIKQSAKDGILKEVISESLDIAIPALGQAAGMALAAKSGNPELGGEIGETIGQIGREKLQEKTGYGMKNVKLSKIMNKYAPYALKDIQNVVKNVDRKAKTMVNKATNPRNELIKKVMKQMKMSLPQASKYIKENNLY